MRARIKGCSSQVPERTMPRALRGGVSLLAAAASLSCGDPATPLDPPPPPPPPSQPPPPAAPVSAPIIIGTADLENFGDARDVQITFRETGNNTGIEEYRIFVARSAAVSGGPPPATGVFEAIDPREVNTAITLRLSAAVTDEASAPLQENVAYVAYVQAWADTASESPISPVSPSFTLTRTDIVESLASLNAGTGGVAVDAAGNVYVADFGTQLSGGVAGNRVFRVTPTGEVSVFATGLVGASGNAFDSKGTLFQSSIAGNTVSSITPDGSVTTFAAGPAIVGPVGIAVAPGDTLFVANCNNNTVAKVAPDGTASTFSTGPLFACPNGIALATDGNLYVANFSNGNLIRVTPDGTASLFLTLPTGNLGHITFGNGVLYVAVRGSHRIYEVTLAGESRVLAGTGARGRRDGPGLQATLSYTNDLALSPDGAVLYFNDVDPSVAGTNTISPSWLRKLRLEGGTSR